MNVNKSQRAFAVVTLTAVFSVAMVLVVYAALLGTINSTGYVYVGGTGGKVYYSLTDTETSNAWQDSLGSGTPIAQSASWYAKMNTTTGGYVGLATITWELKQSTDGGVTWSSAVGQTVTFDYSLNGGVQTIYASTDGTFTAGNRDWHLNTSYGTGLWKVEVTITSHA